MAAAVEDVAEGGAPTGPGDGRLLDQRRAHDWPGAPRPGAPSPRAERSRGARAWRAERRRRGLPRGGLRVSRRGLVSTLERTARLANGISAIASGRPHRTPARLWRLRWGGW